MNTKEHILDLYNKIKDGGTLEGAFDSLNDIIADSPSEVEFLYELFMKEKDHTTQEALAIILIKYKQTTELITFLREKAEWSNEDFLELGISVDE